MTRIEIVLSGSAKAHVNGHSFILSPRRARAGVTPLIARALLAQGHDPKTLVRVVRNRTKVFDDANLAAWASLCVEESDRQSVRFRKYRPWAADELVGGGDQGQAKEREGALA